jgi:hypothetical protein
MEIPELRQAGRPATVERSTSRKFPRMTKPCHRRKVGCARAQDGLIRGKTIGVDSTTLEANAAMKSIVRAIRARAITDTCSDWPKPKEWRQRRGCVEAHGPQTQKEDFQRRLGKPERRRSGDHEAEKTDAASWLTKRRMRSIWRPGQSSR